MIKSNDCISCDAANTESKVIQSFLHDSYCVNRFFKYTIIEKNHYLIETFYWKIILKKNYAKKMKKYILVTLTEKFVITNNECVLVFLNGL